MIQSGIASDSRLLALDHRVIQARIRESPLAGGGGHDSDCANTTFFRDKVIYMFRLLYRVLLLTVVIIAFALFAFRVAAALRETETADALLAGNIESYQPEVHASVPYENGAGFVATSYGKIFILTAGPATGQPVLLAHGSAAWAGFWSPQLRMLGKAGYRATGFDMPPFGFSDRDPADDYSRTRQAARILDIAQSMSQPPIMVAHSFGAAPAAEAVLIQPTAFAGLVIINGALGMEDAPSSKLLPAPIRPIHLREAALSITATNPLATGALLKGLLHNKSAATEDLIRVLQLPQRRLGTTAAYARWLPSLLAPEADTLSRKADRYADLRLPVRIIWGRKDTVTPPDQAERLAEALGQEAVIYIEDAGHIPHVETPDAFDTALLKVLEEVTGAAR